MTTNKTTDALCPFYTVAIVGEQWSGWHNLILRENDIPVAMLRPDQSVCVNKAIMEWNKTPQAEQSKKVFHGVMPDEIYCHQSSSGIIHTWLVPESAYLRGGCNYIRADVDGITAWADGIMGAMGTEYASKVTDEELSLASLISNHDTRAQPKPAQGDSILSGYVFMPDEPTGEIEDEFDAHYSYGFYEAYRAMINAGKNQQIDKYRTQSDAIREWEYLLGEIGAHGMVLHDGTLDILNSFIRAALTEQKDHKLIIEELEKIVSRTPLPDGMTRDIVADVKRMITRLTEQKAVDVESLKRDVFDAVDKNPYIHGVDPLACADFVIDHLTTRYNITEKTK
jgi:hypothetical protein